MNELSWRVLRREAGMRLLQFLREKCPDAPSVKALKRAIDAKLCTINGKVETFSSHILKENDQIVFQLLPSKAKEKISILYEDEELLILNKPVGVISDRRLLNRHFPQYRQKLRLAHRLDKETSGVLILVKNPSAEEKMAALFKERKVHKIYLALVDKPVKQEKGVIDNYLGKKHSYQGQTIYGAVDKKRGQHAITYWKCLKKTKEASLLQCEPHTGRTHQLRVHLNEMGHPILGDTQYSKQFYCSWRPRRNMLHAYSVTFIHPSTGKKIHVIAPIPADFKRFYNVFK